ncbi:Failed axon connections [Portunus trituberculatus]|uniref:Failed axon connections n=1 Tax=Portunus trituberculatus TaxID=210409 RepID=A0A5B7D100_PORTR|nr:Failed axon connections [Portunus trituberculatus]
MTTETETKPVEQTEEKKEEVKEEVKKEEAETNNAEEKADDKAEKADKEKKEEEKKDVKAKKEPAAPKPAVHKLDFNKDVVYLYQFTRTPVLPSLSPYCLKVETWLRIADLKYEVSTVSMLCSMCARESGPQNPARASPSQPRLGSARRDAWCWLAWFGR